MTVRSLFIAFVLLSSLHVSAQRNQPPVTCPATEQAVREVERQIWAAFHTRDLAALDKLIDDDSISTNDDGTSKGKRERLAVIRRPEGDIHTEASEQPEDSRVVFTNGVAILNFTRHWTDYEKKMGIDWGAAVRVTMVFACKNGGWRDVAFQETDMPNKNRKPVVDASDHFDDYVGHYIVSERTATKARFRSRESVTSSMTLGLMRRLPNFFPVGTTCSSAKRTARWRGSFEISPAR